ncbi:MAG: nucleoside triphosphate pyrophosphohydrolase [Desulfovibrionaceae bacterium]|jgi:MazG family protein|nr:nucleoside triphosphate pyrophosphohydrolase [Desulfovibrionaceae bacterium]
MNTDSAPQKFKELLEIVSKLRSPDGCPWDKKQTPESMKPYLLEETHELAEAIDSNMPDHIKEELGDLFFQLSLISLMYEEQEKFTVSDALQAISEKMIRRHPHVFENKSFSSPEELRQNWMKIKSEEKKKAQVSSSNLDVPKSLPALSRAQQVIHRAARSGFHRHGSSSLMSDISSKTELLSKAVDKKQQEEIRRFLGETLFMLVELGRLFELYCEDILQETTTGFVKKYHKMEKPVLDNTGKKLND